MARGKACPKCEGALAEGYLLDHANGSRKVPSWIEGAPQKSVWMSLKLRGRRSLEVATGRCAQCGFLESYAT